MKIPKPIRRGDSWRISVMVSGRRVSSTHDTEKQAREWAARRILELKDQVARASAGEYPKHTLQEVLIRYLNDVSVKKKGYAVERDRINAFIRNNPALVQKYLSEITPQAWTNWRNARVKEVAPSTARRDISLLSAILSYAVKELYWLDTNPFEKVVRPKSPAPRNRRISDDEITMLLDQLDQYSADRPPVTARERTAWVFLFALGTGMRMSEITRMEWRHVKDQYIHLPDSKTGHSRDVPLSDDMLNLLQAARGQHDTRVIPIESYSVKNVFSRAKKRAGVTTLVFKDSRHEASSQLAKILDNPMDLAKITGHKDIRTLLNVYYNPTGDELAEKLKGKKR